MLTSKLLAETEGVGLSIVSCRHEPRQGREVECAPEWALVFVRRGSFRRTVNGVTSFLDPTLAYATNPQDEQRCDHPHGDGDDCTELTLTPHLVQHLTAGDQALPSGPFPTPPAVDLAQRQLLAAAHRAVDPHAVFEHALQLAAMTLRLAQPTQRGVKPATARAQRTVVDAAREALADNPDLTLTGLAHHLAVSPHHLSRLFRAYTGSTLSRHRMRLRARAAVQRLAEGERDLARLAAELGFADQSHLSRVLLDETAKTPAQLRRQLSGQAAVR